MPKTCGDRHVFPRDEFAGVAKVTAFCTKSPRHRDSHEYVEGGTAYTWKNLNPEPEPFFGPHAKHDPESPEFALQTAVMESLPHACTVARMDGNWRKAADELVRLLNNRGFEVRPHA